jgi:hypothetical protein
MTTWTQDDAIAFEAARECLTDMMAICSEAIAAQEALASPNQAAIEQLEVELARLGAEQRQLHLKDREAVARIRTELGPKLRADLRRRRASAGELAD